MLVHTFSALKDIDTDAKKERNIDISDARKDPLVARNYSERSGSAISPSTYESKVCPGTTVTVGLTEAQTRRVALSQSDISNCQQIYETISSLNASHTLTKQNLFSSPFKLVINKKTQQGEFGEMRHPGRVDPKSRKKLPNNSELETEPPEKLGNLINDLKLDSMTESIIEKHWLPTLMKMEEYRLLIGVCPVYFSQFEELVVTYSMLPFEESFDPIRESSDFEASLSSGEDYEDVAGYSGAESRGNGRQAKRTKEKPEDSFPAQAENPTKTFFGKPHIQPFEYDGPEEEALDLLLGKIDQPETASKKSKKKQRELSEQQITLDIEGKGYWGRIIKSGDVGDVIGGKGPYAINLEESFGDAPKIYDDSVTPNAHGLIMDSDGSVKGAGALILDMSEQLREASYGFRAHENRSQGGGRPDIRFVNTREGPYTAKEKRKREMHNAKKNAALIRKAEELEEKNSGDENDGQTSYPSSPLYPSPSPLGPKVENPKKRKRNQARSGQKHSGEEPPVKFRKIETKVTHYVPFVPELKLGTIEVANDIGGNSYFWIWKTDDKFKGSIEPFMQWVLFDEPSSDGRLKSPVSSMLRDYQRYLQLNKVEETPLFVIEKPEPKIPAPPAGGVLSGQNYVPMLGNLAGNGYYQPGSSLELDEFQMNAVSRDRLLSGPGIPMQPRSYLPAYGPNAPPHWDTGVLLSQDSAEYQRSQRVFGEANALNSGDFGSSSSRVASGTATSARGYEQAFSSMTQRATADEQNFRHTYDEAALRQKFQSRVSEALSLSTLLGRYTTYTQQGMVVFLEPGERLVKMDNPVSFDPSAGLEIREKLDIQGMMVGGSPNSIYLQGSSSKGKQAEGIFTSKDNTAVGNYGFNMTSTSQSSYKESSAKTMEVLQHLYGRVIKQLFICAYKNVFRSEEEWYRKIVGEAFSMEINAYREKNRRRLASGKKPKNYVLPEVPLFESLFEVNVTFQMLGPGAGLSQILDLYKLGALDPEEVLLQIGAQFPSIFPSERLLTMRVEKSADDDQGFKTKVESLRRGMDNAITFEIDKALKKDKPKPLVKKSKTKTKSK